MKLTFDGLVVDLTSSGKGYLARIEDKSVSVEVLRVENGQLDLLFDNQRVTAYVSSDNAKRWVTINGRTFLLTKSSGAKRRDAGRDHASELAAPMPGLVRSVNVQAGESVTKGQTLLLLEAMKMEIRIHAPRDGVVKKLFVNQGQTVEREQILIELE